MALIQSNLLGTAQSNILGTAQPQAATPKYKHSDLRADLVWGPSGAGKTWQMYLSALQMYKRYGKKTRYLSADGGSLGPLASLVKLGILRVFSLGVVPYKFRLEAVDLIMSGVWPIFDPDKGVWSFKAQAAKPTSATFDEWGQLITEGLTSVGDMSMRDLIKREDIKIPQTPDRNEFFVTSGEQKWTFRAPAHFGFVQERMEEWVGMSSVLPYQRVLWTARELRAESKNGDTIVGPELPGKAATGSVPGWFGACLHLVAVPGELITDDRPDLSSMAKGKFKKMEHRLYLIPHPDGRTGITLDSKNRLPAEVVPMLTKTGYIRSEVLYEVDAKGKEIVGPDGNPIVKERIGLNTYYDMEAKLQDVNTAILAKELGMEIPSGD